MDLTTPTLTITNPQPGQKVKGSIQLEATATDNTGVDRVEFWVDGLLVGTEKVLPYSSAFDTTKLSNADHKIIAIAYDDAGNSATTAVLTFSVDNTVVVPVDPFWTVFSPAAQTVYVSSSLGNDANDGSSDAKAVKTLAKGYGLLKEGRSNLLLKKGDTWRECFPLWTKSGLSVAQPLLVSSYGTGERPVISPTGTLTADGKPTDANTLRVLHAKVSFVAFVGIHFTSLRRTPSEPDFSATLQSDTAIRWQSSGQYLLLEDCLIDFHRVALVLEVDKFSNLQVRRCVVANQWAKAADGHSQGLYVEDVSGFLLEENFIDSNGWSLATPGAGATMFNHNVYQQVETSGAVVKGNIFSRAAATGIQMRGGGVCQDNVFLRNPIGLTFGLVNGAHLPAEAGVVGAITGNFFSEGSDIDAATPRGNALGLGNTKDVSVHDNLFSVCASPKHYHGAIEFDCNNGAGLQKLTLKDNSSYKWDPMVSFNSTCGSKAVQSNNVTTGSWPNPGQTIDAYDPAFFDKARKQSKAAWDPKLGAESVLKFFRSGFGK